MCRILKCLSPVPPCSCSKTAKAGPLDVKMDRTSVHQDCLTFSPTLFHQSMCVKVKDILLKNSMDFSHCCGQ